MRKHLSIGLAMLVVLALGQTPSRAAFMTTVTATVTAQGTGFLYSYTLANSVNSTVGVTEFDIDMVPTADLTALTAPTGFLALYTPGDTFIQFLSTAAAFDIAPGASGVFSFTSLVTPGLAVNVTRGFDPTGAPAENLSRTFAPVPEPSSLVLFGLGLAALPILRSSRRRAALQG